MRKVSLETDLLIYSTDNEQLRAKHITAGGEFDFPSTPEREARNAKLNELHQEILERLNRGYLDDALLNEIMDRIYEGTAIMQADMETLSVCGLGCAHCCRLPLSIGISEIVRIRAKTGIKAKTMRPKFDGNQKKKVKSYCPFLDTGTAACSIWEHRPFECRAFMTFDSHKFCERTNKRHSIAHANSTGWGSEMLRILAFMSNELSKAMNLPPLADVRQWYGHGKRVSK